MRRFNPNPYMTEQRRRQRSNLAIVAAVVLAFIIGMYLVVS